MDSYKEDWTVVGSSLRDSLSANNVRVPSSELISQMLFTSITFSVDTKYFVETTPIRHNCLAFLYFKF